MPSPYPRSHHQDPGCTPEVITRIRGVPRVPPVGKPISSCPSEFVVESGRPRNPQGRAWVKEVLPPGSGRGVRREGS